MRSLSVDAWSKDFRKLATKRLSTADDDPRWRGPGFTHGSNAVLKIGPAAPELRADAHYCIMVRIRWIPRIQVCGAKPCLFGEVPLGKSQ